VAPQGGSRGGLNAPQAPCPPAVGPSSPDTARAFLTRSVIRRQAGKSLIAAAFTAEALEGLEAPASREPAASGECAPRPADPDRTRLPPPVARVATGWS
jgi:hypothetical protein